MKNDIAVIGAGIAGLTAAYYLKKFGYDVVVYEAANRVGGRMTTDAVHGCLIDRGAQFLSIYYPTLIPLMNEVGMQGDLLETSPWSGIVRREKIRKISSNHILSPILSGYLTIKEAALFFRQLKRWQDKILSLPLDDYSLWMEFDNESCADFTLREFGKTILEYMIEPQTQGFYFQTPEEISNLQSLMLLNFALRKGNLRSLKLGMGSLSEKLASLLNIKLNSPISSLLVESNGTVTLSSNIEKFYANKVVLATPATVSKALYLSANKFERVLLETPYSSTINVSILLQKEWKLPHHFRHLYGFLIPKKERKLIAAIGIESNKNKNSTKEGELLNIMLDNLHANILLNKSDNEIIKAIMPELEIYFPKLSDFSRFFHIVRWQEALPLSFIGKASHIKKYKETLNSNASVILAGDYMGFPSADGAAFTGKWAANFISENN